MSKNQTAQQVAQSGAEDAASLRRRLQRMEMTLEHVTEQLLRTQESCMIWEQTFNSVSDPMAVISSDCRLLRANAAYQRLLETESRGSDARICFDDTHAPYELYPLHQTALSLRPEHERYQRTGPDSDELHTFDRWIYPVVNSDGTVDRVVEIIKDVTEEMELRDAKSAAEALRQADRLKAELLGAVSHELRSPLAAIQGYAETLIRHEKRLPMTERLEFLSAIQTASVRLSGIVDRMLELSELETGTYPLRVSPVDLAQIASEAFTSMWPRDREGQQAQFKMLRQNEQGQPVDMLPLVLGDARLLRDLLDHLIENAVKYSPAGGAITVRFQPVLVAALPGLGEPGAIASETTPRSSEAQALDESDHSYMMEVTVQDEGIGIPPDHLPRIFDRFHQVDSSLTREGDGMGLGLAICQRIAEMHRGSIWAESTPGNGSAFHVLLPLASAMP